MTGDRLYLEAIDQIGVLMDEAAAAGELEVNAMSLATAAQGGGVSVRMVLLKGLSAAGLTFYTNLESRKSRQLATNPHAALCFHWKKVARQIRVEGVVSPVDSATADDYFASRDRGSQIGAWASDQSRVLEDRAQLERRISVLEAQYAGQDVPRPPHWSGFCLAPHLIEFWQGRESRLHERWCYERGEQTERWSKRLLYP